MRTSAIGLAALLLVAACGGPAPSGSSPAPSPSDAPSVSPAPPTPETPAPPTPGPTAIPTPTPAPTPAPTPELAVAPLTGRLVAPALAARHPIAVMVDDQVDARPQSGFNEASVVWQAPAEGGIPRYMLIFAEGNPSSVGPVRSARDYYVHWAAEWTAVYAHAGGSPGALALLAARGNGDLVYDASAWRWEGRLFWRTSDRFAPHNVYTDGKSLRAVAKQVGAEPIDAPPAWRFATDAALELRPAGSRLGFAYRTSEIVYRYHRPSNTWRRYVQGKLHRDPADGAIVAPKNVVVMEVVFGLLGDLKGRLDADTVGSGRAWIATNGTTIRGTWKKASLTAPTRFLDRNGNPVVLTAGQTFVQVVPSGTKVTFVNGTRIFDPAKAAERGVL